MTKDQRTTCDHCGVELGDGWCRACDAEADRLAGRPASVSRTLRATPTDEPPTIAEASVADVLGYLYAEAGIRANMLGATKEERLAHIAVRQDIRELASHYQLRG